MSDYQDWKQLIHSEKWLLFTENIGNFLLEVVLFFVKSEIIGLKQKNKELKYYLIFPLIYMMLTNYVKTKIFFIDIILYNSILKLDYQFIIQGMIKL